MRQIHKQTGEAVGRKVREPLTEGIAVPLDSRGRRMWNALGDEEIVAHAKRFAADRKIELRTKLLKADPGLYDALYVRGLLGKVGLKEKRNWSAMGREEIVEEAKKSIKEMGVRTPAELRAADEGLHAALWRRGLLYSVGLARERGERHDWKSMDDGAMRKFAVEFIKENPAKDLQELKKMDRCLYEELRRRHLLGGLGLGEPKTKRPQGFFKKKTDEELIEFTKAVSKEEGIPNISKLQRKFGGVYNELRARNLLDDIGLRRRGARKTDQEATVNEENRAKDAGARGKRDWKGKSDSEVLECARALVREGGITNRGELYAVDRVLHNVLVERGLMKHLGFRDGWMARRKWKGKSHDELVEAGIKLAREKNLPNKKALERADLGLYIKLNRLKLLDRVFSEIGRERQDEVLAQLREAVDLYTRGSR